MTTHDTREIFITIFYCMIDNEEFISEMVAVTVPIVDKKSRYLASLYIHAPTIRVSLDELLTHVPRLQQAAQDIQALIYDLQS